MNVTLAFFVVIGFAAILEYLSLPDHAREVRDRSNRSLEVLRDDSLSDQEKEETLQHQSGQLFRLLGILVVGSVLALGLPLGIVWILAQVGIGSFWGTIDILERIDFIMGVTVAGLLGYFVFRQMEDSS